VDLGGASTADSVALAVGAGVVLLIGSSDFELHAVKAATAITPASIMLISLFIEKYLPINKGQLFRQRPYTLHG
jgi:hypothetical protein